MMNEALLKFAWKHRLYRPVNLLTTTETPISVLKPGRENTNAGPDFFMAELCLGETRWAGNVEIHTKSSDWYLHGHQHDAAYNNVILHVVFEHDNDVFVNGEALPTLELKHFLTNDFLANYTNLATGSYRFLPCEKSLSAIESIQVNTWLNRLLVERLLQRTEQIKLLFDNNQQDLQETAYQWLLMGFGRQVNKDAFLQLAIAVPQNLLRKYVHDEVQLQALLFGQSGLLPAETNDDYVASLIAACTYLKQKHRLQPMNAASWKFLRMRPVNFPTLRIAQLAAFLANQSAILDFYKLELSASGRWSLGELRLNPFWDNHYSFSASKVNRPKYLGEDFSQHLQINVLAPLRIFYQQLQGNDWIDEVENFFHSLPAEHNAITRKMESAGFKNTCSAHSQGLLQLHNLYCEEKKCLLCNVGYQILRG